MQVENIKDALDQLAIKWKIDPIIYDVHLGLRQNITDTIIKKNNVIFHIPTIKEKNKDKFILWNCLWPECSNCCYKQGRLPLTKDDLLAIKSELGYESVSEYLKKEVKISSWEEDQSINNLITSLTMLSLKRNQNEKDEEDGKPIKCRFLDDKDGGCSIQNVKPGVCWLYPFSSWVESYNDKILIHASFQFTGDCPGFYLSDNIADMYSILDEYAKKIYEYNMSINRTLREGFGSITFIYKNMK